MVNDVSTGDCHIRFGLRPGVLLATSGEQLRLLRKPPWHADEAFGPPTPARRALLARLATGTHRPDEAALPAQAEATPGTARDDAGLDDFLRALDAGGWLTRTLAFRGRDLYTVQPLRAAPRTAGREAPAAPRAGSDRAMKPASGAAAPPSPGPSPADGTAPGGVRPPATASIPPDAPDANAAALSRFAVIRREGRHIVIESPLAHARILVHSADVVAYACGLTVPSAIGSAAGADDGRRGHPGGDTERGPGADQLAGPAAGSLPGEVGERLLHDLCAAGLTEPAVAVPDRDIDLWSPQDLWFHVRSRQGDGGYSGRGFGRTLWARSRHAPLPARREPFPGPVIPLHRPDLEVLRATDRTLTTVVEDRRSTRVHDDGAPITADQLGELLYRCARVRGSVTRDGVEYLSRPHPSGGGLYELELYPVVRRATGLEPGMYHYDAHAHGLRLVRPPGPEVARLLQNAAGASAMTRLPQVLVVVAARFGRLMWSYEELPYALVLKDVGVLYQTLYLVATSMGLAACGLGGGDALAFTEATGLGFTVESSVGEFVLGSAPAR